MEQWGVNLSLSAVVQPRLVGGSEVHVCCFLSAAFNETGGLKGDPTCSSATYTHAPPKINARGLVCTYNPPTPPIFNRPVFETQSIKWNMLAQGVQGWRGSQRWATRLKHVVIRERKSTPKPAPLAL